MSQASYAIVEVERGKPVAVEQRRVTYDIELAAQKILAAGLPEALGRRLFTGY